MIFKLKFIFNIIKEFIKKKTIKEFIVKKYNAWITWEYYYIYILTYFLKV
jgi:hypothetical protein